MQQASQRYHWTVVSVLDQWTHYANPHPFVGFSRNLSATVKSSHLHNTAGLGWSGSAWFLLFNCTVTQLYLLFYSTVVVKCVQANVRPAALPWMCGTTLDTLNDVTAWWSKVPTGSTVWYDNYSNWSPKPKQSRCLVNKGLIDSKVKARQTYIKTCNIFNFQFSIIK